MQLPQGVAFLAFLAVVSAAPEPQAPGQNQYLPPPPKPPGYNYPTPQVPFVTPTRPPTSFVPPDTYKPPSIPPYKPDGGGQSTSYIPPPTGPTTRPPYNPPGPPTGPPFRPPTPGGEEHHHDHHEPGMPYDFAYAVKDAQFGTDYNRQETSDGDTVRGEYRVQLPDGRLQVVRYTADWRSGFHADVQYEGQARYPDQPQGPGSRPF